ncbi:unnamed protein product [Thelazia callipaeda]|uniref:Ubiquitin-like domain-containing protein n=1 Tax=Thelazia callipaeda TaxID=103827 RepID=A0A0N5CX62_THECL|nr:unnamed protein product [Thelazia callipaeda]
MADDDVNDIGLLIRCALQSFDDLLIRCPSSWTVYQLKEKLAVDCPSKPNTKSQRLIYAGHCLHDDRTLKSVFEHWSVNDESVHVIHLVCPPKNFAAYENDSVLRKRKTSSTQSSSASSRSETAAPLNQNGNGAFQFYANPPWANSFAQANYVTPQAMLNSSNAHFQSVYQAYMLPPQLLFDSVQSETSTLPQPPQQVNQPQGVFPVEPNLAAAPAAGGFVQQAMAGDVDDQQRDFLDVIYKAIRMCFLIMLVYVYSSAERFFGVLIFILLVWFIQARRDRNNRERADRELAAAVDNFRQPHPANENQGVAEGMNEVVGATLTEQELREPTAWVVFWSTCYTFITTFFSSLIPDNPVPVNIN